MNDQHEADAAPVVKVARHLTAIETMAGQLADQAIHSANDRDLPGGNAMVALAPVADPDQYAENVEAAELRHMDDPLRYPASTLDMAHEDDDLAPVLQTLRSWSTPWRALYGFPLDGRRATVATETGFLRGMLNTAWDDDLRWDAFAADIAAARRRLEDTVKDGRRDQPTRVLCDRPHCERRPRLIVVPGEQLDGSDNRFKCPGCRSWYDADEFARTYAHQLRSEGAQRFIPKADAILTLAAQGTPERTVRDWLATDTEDQVDSRAYCELGSRRVLVWWPSLWRRHLMWQQARARRKIGVS